MHHHLLFLGWTNTEELTWIICFDIKALRSHLLSPMVQDGGTHLLFGVKSFDLETIKLDIEFLYKLIEDIVALSH